MNWRPDWRDESSYPEANYKVSSKRRFSWEFLRRNSEYRDDFQSFVTEANALDEEAKRRLSFRLSRRWALYQMVDPSDNWNPHLDGTLKYQGLVLLYPGEHHPEFSIDLRPQDCAAVFDLTQPLSLLLAHFERRVKQELGIRPDLRADCPENWEAKKRHRADPKATNLVKYLRALDAYEEVGASGFEALCVAEVLIANPQNTSWNTRLLEILHNAEHYRDQGYRDLGQDVLAINKS